MRSFCNLLPNDSVSFLASGVDTLVVSQFPDESEILRALHPEGIILSYLSNLITDNSQFIYDRGLEPLIESYRKPAKL